MTHSTTFGAVRSEAVTPSDTVDLPMLTRGLLVGVAGAVSVEYEDGTSATIPLLSAGMIHPIQVVRVNSTSTTATSIMAFY